MHAGKRFTLKEALYWTRRDIYIFILLSTLPVLFYELLGCRWMSLPWLPIALVGTSVAFLIGFKNNATYDRMWEARKIWGAIVNSSRTWGIFVKDFVTNKHTLTSLSKEELKQIHQRLIYRHLGWLTSLRYQLRQPKHWETMDKAANKEYKKFYEVPEEHSSLEDELNKYLSPEDKTYILSKRNRATHSLSLQSTDLRGLLEEGLIEDFRHMELEKMLADFFTQQGKAERIKNFPYPRHFATINVYFIWLFIILVPFGMMREFAHLGQGMVWLTIPFSILVSWVFSTMDKIGEITENPFQGAANDIPMAALSRTIEIDLREMLDETDLPQPAQAINNILM